MALDWLSDLVSGISDWFGGGGGQTVGESLTGASSNLVSEPGFDWGSIGSGFGSLAKGALSAGIPAVGSGLAGLAIKQMFPGQPAGHRLVDMRQDVTRTGANMALERAQNIQRNPNSFGLPGDPMDVNTPAGQRRYSIIKSVRDADAARSFNTGGSAQRESTALNKAVGDEYNAVMNSSMGTLQGQPQMAGYQTPAQEDPWGKMLAGAVSPAVSKGLSRLLADWGMSA